jgi:hypothetical protein
MSKRLPRAARPIDAVEPSGDLIEENLRLFAAAGEDALEIDLVAAVFGQFLRAADGELDEFAGVAGGLWIEFLKCPLAFAPRLHERAVREQAEVRGDARLAEARNFLKFVHGQFVPLQQCHDAQPRRVGQRPQ